MLWVRLSDKLKLTVHEDESVISWQKLKAKLAAKHIIIDKELLTGCEFLSELEEQNGIRHRISSKEYARMSGTATSPSDDIQQLRTDLAELRRESTWLLNSFFSVIGVGAFVYFVVSFYFERVEARMIVALLAGLLLFFIEVILLIIRGM